VYAPIAIKAAWPRKNRPVKPVKTERPTPMSAKT